MREVGVRELRNRLSAYLRMVREGEVILITDRGRVVAQMASTIPGDIPAGLLELTSRGAAKLGSPNDPAAYDLDPHLSSCPDGTGLGLLNELRGDR